MFYDNLMYLWRLAHAIVYMQVIDAVRQAGNIELHRTAFGSLVPLNSTQNIVQTDIIRQVLP